MLVSYSFGELAGPSEQRQALKAMWQATADILVIVEPGTPAGSGLVRAARAQVESINLLTYILMLPQSSAQLLRTIVREGI